LIQVAYVHRRVAEAKGRRQQVRRGAFCFTPGERGVTKGIVVALNTRTERLIFSRRTVIQRKFALKGKLGRARRINHQLKTDLARAHVRRPRRGPRNSRGMGL